VKPTATPLADEMTRELDAMVSRRAQIVSMIAMEKNRLGQATKATRKDIELLLVLSTYGPLSDVLLRRIPPSGGMFLRTFPPSRG
jgi:chorismate mutase